MSKAFVITHPEMGIYLGSCMGLGFWTKLDAAGQPCAATFPTETAAETFMASWDEGRPKGATLVLVEPDDGTYASAAACVAAGLEGWSHVPVVPALMQMQDVADPENQVRCIGNRDESEPGSTKSRSCRPS